MNFTLKKICVAPEGRRLVTTLARKEDESTRRRRSLRRIDSELAKGNFKAALTLVKQLQGRPGSLRGFGSVELVREVITLVDDPEVNGVESRSTRSVVDSVLQSIESCRQLALEEEEEDDEEQELQRAMLSLRHSDTGQERMDYGGYYDSLSNDRGMCLQHEAGHFLTGYLVGVLPKRYKIPTMEDLWVDNFAGGNIEFLGFEFLTEAFTSVIPNLNGTKALVKYKENRRMVSSKTLNRFMCVILGGLVAEQLGFGNSELMHSDVEKLDRVLKWLGFNVTETCSRIRWAATTTVLILRQHDKVTPKLVEAMALGQSIGSCIEVIESTLADK